jgi:hypothetical protein
VTLACHHAEGTRGLPASRQANARPAAAPVM